MQIKKAGGAKIKSVFPTRISNMKNNQIIINVGIPLSILWVKLFPRRITQFAYYHRHTHQTTFQK